MSVSTPKSREERLREAIRIKQAQNRARDTDIPVRTPGTRPELHDLQRGMWLAHTLEPGSAAYNLVSACRLRGEVEEDLLEQAFRELVSRHRLLRSSFQVRGDVVEQCIHDSVDVGLERLGAEPGGLMDVATAAAQRPFDLEKAPLVRLVRVGEAPGEESGGERLLMLVLHHLLADERSLGDLWREMGSLMSGTSLPFPGPQYDDWVVWRRAEERRDPAQAERDLSYWLQRLEVPPGDLQLPFLAPVSHDGSRGRLLVSRLADQAAASLRQWAAGAGTTPFVAGAFACRLLLQRLALNSDFALGTPVSLRHHPAMRSMLGAFINPVLITGAVDETAPAERELEAFGGALREAMGHGSLPFAVLADRLAPERSDGSHPLFQAMYVHQEHEALPPLGKAALEPVQLDLGVAKFDLTLFLAEQGDAMEIALEYRRDRFRSDDMEWLLEVFGALLTWLPTHSDAPLESFEWLGASEHAWLENVSRGEALDPLGPAACDLLPVQIARLARQQPETPAVRAGDGALDYAALQSRAAVISAALEAAGVGVGDRVGVFLPRGGELIPGLLGIHGLRAAYVPLDPAYPAARNRAVLADADVRAVLTTTRLAHDLPGGDWRLVRVDGPEAAATEPPEAPSNRTPNAPGDLAYLLYTSGSTGRPKGVMVSQGNLQASTAARLQVYGGEPPRFLLLPSVAFDSSVAGLFGTLAAGGTLVVPTDEAVRDPRELVALIRSERVSHLLCVPSLYENLLEADPSIAAALEVVIVAGERCPPDLVEHHFEHGPETRLFNEYGPTEATVWASVYEITPGSFEGEVPIGRPIPGVRIDVLDRRGRVQPPGVPGAGWISGPTVAAGYWNRPERSAERFADRLPGRAAPVPAYRTGDRLSWDRQGRLNFHGREDEQIKLRGFRIEPGEVEAALEGLPGISRTAVIVRPLEAGPGAPQHLVAFMEGALDEAAPWREALASQLPPHMVPTRLERLERLPRLPNGKIDRGRLADWPLSPRKNADMALSLSSREAELRSLWRDILGRDDVGPEDHFFILGGTSLLAVKLALRMEREFGVVLPPAEIFAHPTLRSLAARLDEEAPGPEADFDHLFPIETSGSGDPLIFAIPHFFADLVAELFRGERPVWGLRGIGHRAEGNLGRWPTLEALGSDLVRELEQRFPERPVFLAGYSFGASMAHEMAVQLERSGVVVRRLFLIAPMPLDMARVGPLRLQIDALDEPVESLSAGVALGRWLRANHPLTLDLYRRAWRRMGIGAWRRFQCQLGRWRRRRGQPLTERMQWADVRVDRFRLHTKYQPEPTAVPTVIFNGVEPATDAAATWRSRYTGPLEVVPIPDPHGDEAAVAQARALIRERLLSEEQS